LTLTPDQAQLSGACATLLARRAGPERARDVRGRGGLDAELLAALDEAGFLDLFADPDAGPLAAALVTEWTAEAAGVAPVGLRTLVAPAVLDGGIPRAVSVVRAGSPGPVRFAAEAEVLLVLDGDDASVARTGDWTATAVPSTYGYPLATVEVHRSEPLASGAGAVARRWWQVAVAAEVAGSARAAVQLTNRYLKDREQFDRPLATFQALQHRLADCLVRVEGMTWLARLAADRGADPELAASAAVAAVDTARAVMAETHQLTGAMGFTLEYDLHLWSLRLQALRSEAGGLDEHARALVAARWA
jgi:alkylation response protein AidB-like acyl-CoA dehydrogenase